MREMRDESRNPRADSWAPGGASSHPAAAAAANNSSAPVLAACLNPPGELSAHMPLHAFHSCTPLG